MDLIMYDIYNAASFMKEVEHIDMSHVKNLDSCIYSLQISIVSYILFYNPFFWMGSKRGLTLSRLSSNYSPIISILKHLHLTDTKN